MPSNDNEQIPLSTIPEAKTPPNTPNPEPIQVENGDGQIQPRDILDFELVILLCITD